MNKGGRPPTGQLYKRAFGSGMWLRKSDPRPGKYYLRFRGKSIQKSVNLETDDLATAERAAARIVALADAESGGSEMRLLENLVQLGKWAESRIQGRPVGGKLSLDDAMEIYVAQRGNARISAGSIRCDWSHYRGFFKWAAAQGMSRVAAITDKAARAYVGVLEKNCSASTIAKRLMFLRRLWKANNAGDLWQTVAYKSSRGERFRRLDIGEIRGAFGELDGELRMVFAVGYYTGLRLKDIVFLSHEKYDEGRAVLELEAFKTRGKKGVLFIPVLPELQKLIASDMGVSRSGAFFRETSERYKTKSESISRRLSAAFRRGGVLSDARGKASFHSLRASFITAMDEVGAPESVTDSITGHAPKSMHGRYSQPKTAVARMWMEKALALLEPVAQVPPVN